MALGEKSLSVVSRTIQWRTNILNWASSTKSFQFGGWTWNLDIRETYKPSTYNKEVSLYLSAKNGSDHNLRAEFILRVTGDISCFSKVLKECFKSGSEPIGYNLHRVTSNNLIIELEFLNLETSRPNDEQLVSEWPTVGPLKNKEAANDPLNCLSRMFTESIHTDLIINTKNGTLSAHTALLAASSPVFARMFDNDFKEKCLSTVDIQDMSLESCKAFFNYLYGNLRQEDLLSYRIELLGAAHKYGVVKLQKLCEESLQEDIGLSNVLDRLSLSHFYELKNLKQDCLSYLFDMEKVAVIKDAFIRFVFDTDQKLATELLELMLPK